MMSFGAMAGGVSGLLLVSAYVLSSLVLPDPVRSHASSGLLWAPAGVALGGLFVGGLRLWPAVALGSLLTSLWFATAPATALVIAGVRTAEAVLGAFLVRRKADAEPGFSSFAEVLVFFVGGVVVPPMVLTAIGAALLPGSSPLGFVLSWQSWWVADSAGAAVVGSTIVAWQGSGRGGFDRRALRESGAFFVALALVIVVGLWSSTPDVSVIFRTGLWVSVMVWGALIFGTRGASLTVYGLAVMWVVRSRDGSAFFDITAAPLEPIWLLVVLLLITITPLGFATVLQRRRELTDELRDRQESLRDAVDRLDAREAHLRHAQRLAHIGSYEQPLGGAEGFWSDEVFRILGLDPERDDILKEDLLLRFLYPEDRKVVEAAVRGAIADGGTFDVECRFVRADGAIRRVRTAGDVVMDDDGRPVKLVGTLRDQTDQVRAEEIEASYRALVDAAVDMIMRIDLDGRILSWNRGAEKMMGYSASEIVGRSVLDLPEDVAYAAEVLRAAVAGGTVVAEEFVALHKDGSKLDVSVTVSPIEDVAGTRTGLSVIAQEVGPKKRMEAMLQEKQKVEALGSLAGGIAHDFNNLLSVILGNTRLIQRRVSGDDGVERLLGEIDTATSRASDLVDQILTFARARDVGNESVEFCDVVRETLALVERLAGPDLEVVHDISTEEMWVSGDRSQLGQVVMNLCTNGLGAMPQGGRLRVAVAPTDSGAALVLEVADTGHGIAPENLERIFDPFFTTKERGRGTGLGLATVNAVVASVGGTIDVQSEVGVGTRFRVELPLTAAPEHQAAADESPSRDAGTRKGEEILVVDDEPQVLEVMAELLRDAGYRVTSSGSGKEALDMLRAEPARFRLLVTDQIMPVLKGDELVRKARTVVPGLPTIIVSGYHDPLGPAPPAGEILRKPVEPATLIARVQHSLSPS